MAFTNGFFLSLSLCLDLGVVNAAIINTALRNGTQRGFMVGFGSCFGDLFYAALSVAGLSLVAGFAPVRWALWICGSALLLWLAARALAAAWRERGGKATEVQPNVDAIDAPGLGGLFLKGLGLAIASPSSLVWFAAIGGALIARATNGEPGSIAAFLAGFFFAGMVWSFGVALAFGRLHQRVGSGFAFWTHICSAILFAVLAGIVIVDGLKLVGSA